MSGALQGLRVLDLTHLLTGPFATKLLADYGADVIKVEPPGGEPGRNLAPFKGDDPHPDKSGPFFMLNTNKRGLTLNLKSAAGREALLDLARNANIVVENFRPGVMANLGIGYEDLKAVRPDIVLLSISNFGQTGPFRDWKGSETILYGMGGEMHSAGLAGRAPTKQGGTVTLFQAGAMAAVAAMAGVTTQRVHGVGQWIDLSIYEAQMSSPDRRAMMLIAYQFAGVLQEKPEIAQRFSSGVFPCKDGYVEIYGDVTKWDTFTAMLGNPPELIGPEFHSYSVALDPAKKELLDSIFYPWLMERTKVEVWHEAQKHKVLCGPLYTAEDLMKDEYYQSRGFWVDVEHAVMGKLKIPGRFFVMSETPWELRRPAPLLGEHTAEVLAEAGYSRERIVMLREAGAI